MPYEPVTPGNQLSFTIPGDQGAVRDALREIVALLKERQWMTCDPCDLEIVLAEIMNNVVEHAYREKQGILELKLLPVREGLQCQIVDHGAPMPGGNLPEGLLAEPGEGDELPEGGFGWFLIRTLSKNLEYRRENGANRLSFFLSGDSKPL